MDWKRILIGKWSWKRPFQSLLSIYLLLGIVAVFFADRIIFVAPAPSYPKELKGLIHLTTAAGERIAALHYPAASGMPTLLYSHGNAEDLGHSLELYQSWSDRGFGILAYDYPGYGHSNGTPDEASCKRAIQAAWDHLAGLGVPAGSVVLVCRSVGGGPGTWLASHENPAGLVLIAPFTSAYAVAIPLPFPVFPRDRFPNLKTIRTLPLPLLVIHGENDEVIPPSHGRKLVEASPGADKAFSLVPDAGHNDLFEIAGDSIIGQVADFADRVARQPR
jgi:alpha-beta hydrolase superfamily lysophospholipase